MKLHYPAIFLKEDDGRYTVLFPNIPKAVTCGQNYENAVEMAKECLELCIKGRVEDHEEIPKARFENIETRKNEMIVEIEINEI